MAFFNSIMVPLDGSELSAEALPAACLMADVAGSPITLLRSFEGVPQWHADADLGRFSSSLAVAEHDRIKAYLTAEKHRLQELDVHVPIDVFVGEGRAESVITNLAGREPDRLIVMSTHGRGGLSRMVMGSVTARVVGSVSNPTLIVRGGALDGVRVGRSLDNVIVPLDGSAFAERALAYAGELARACGAQVILVRSTRSSDYLRAHTQWTRMDDEGGFHFGGPTEMASSMVALSREYLWGKAEEMETRFGLSDVEAVNSLEDPADAVVDLAKRSRNAVVIMATRGRWGVGRALLGSVADQVVRRSPTPTLLVRAPLRTGEVAHRANSEDRERDLMQV